MAIVGISMVKNEADVIEAMARHNLAFLDHLHFVDNGSTDRTVPILKLLKEEGLSISVTADLRLGYPQADILSKAANARFPNDTLFFLDADECLIGRIDQFRTALRAQSQPFLMPWVTYVPTPADNADDINPLTRIQHRRVSESPQYFKVALPANTPRPVVMQQGAHGLDGYRPAPISDIAIAHFPVRSVQQIISKILVGSWNMRLRPLKETEGYQWHDLAKKMIEGRLPTARDLQAIGANYTCDTPGPLTRDPLPAHSQPLKYTTETDTNALHNIMAFTEGLVGKIGPRQ